MVPETRHIAGKVVRRGAKEREAAADQKEGSESRRCRTATVKEEGEGGEGSLCLAPGYMESSSWHATAPVE